MGRRLPLPVNSVALAGRAEVGNASNSSARNVHQKRAHAHHSSLNTKHDCLKIVDTFRYVRAISVRTSPPARRVKASLR